MNKLIRKVLKESNVEAKISNNGNVNKFKVIDNNLTLEGVIKGNNYSMSIKDKKGNVIDSVSSTVSNSNDVVNRMNESITTLKQLSPVYDKQLKLQEDEEFEDIPEAEPGDLDGAINELNVIYDKLMDFADDMANVGNYFEEDDAENKNKVTSFVGAIYDIAMDTGDFVDDIVESMEDEEGVTESVQPRKSLKYATKMAINNITIAESLLRGHKSMDSVRNVLRDIKAELIVNNK